MTNIEFTQNLLRNINFDMSKLNPKFICDDAQLASETEINQMFGSFADMRVFIAQNIRNGNLVTPMSNVASHTTETNNETSSHNDNGGGDGPVSSEPKTEAAPTKVVRIMKHDGTLMKCKAPAGMNIKDILQAAGVNTEEGFEIRVNNEKEDDVYSVPDDGALISATRQIKGN